MTTSPLLAVIGDDATGTLSMVGALSDALDRPGSYLDPAAPLPEAGIVGIDTRTRSEASPDVAYDLVLGVARRLASAQVGLLAKRFDSALRGHIVAEARAIIDAGHGPVLGTGAYPALGRVMRDGVVTEAGAPVTARPAPADSQSRAATASLADSLSAAGLRVRLLPLDVVREPSLLNRTFDRALDKDVLLFDAEELADYLGVAAAASAHRFAFLAADPLVMVSAALARRRRAEAGSVLCVVGSPHPRAREQVRFARHIGLTLDAIDLTRMDGCEAARHTESALLRGRDVLVHTGSTDHPGRHDHTQRLRELGEQLAESSAVRALVVVGGETTRAMLDGFGFRDIAPLARWDVGECLSTATTGRGRQIPVLTRSGGAGERGSLLMSMWRLAARLPGESLVGPRERDVGERSEPGGAP